MGITTFITHRLRLWIPKSSKLRNLRSRSTLLSCLHNLFYTIFTPVRDYSNCLLLSRDDESVFVIKADNDHHGNCRINGFHKSFIYMFLFLSSSNSSCNRMLANYLQSSRRGKFYRLGTLQCRKSEVLSIPVLDFYCKVSTCWISMPRINIRETLHLDCLLCICLITLKNPPNKSKNFWIHGEIG